jgi:antirestriction protein ArdC
MKSFTNYAREELVAQGVAVILTQHFKIGPDDLSRQKKYFQHCLALAGDREEALAYAKAETEKAVRYILGLTLHDRPDESGVV